MKTALAMSVVLLTFVIGVVIVLSFVERFDPAESTESNPVVLKYLYVSENNIFVNWTTAKKECSTIGPDVRLASILSKQENDVVLQLVDLRKPFQDDGKRLYWLDGIDSMGTGNWVWSSTSQPVEGFINWEHQSDNHTMPDSEDMLCMATRVDVERGMTLWTKLDCSYPSAGYVCERLA